MIWLGNTRYARSVTLVIICVGAAFWIATIGGYSEGWKPVGAAVLATFFRIGIAWEVRRQGARSEPPAAIRVKTKK